MHIGQRIAQTRKQKNMTQGDLAKGIVSVSHLSNIEAGRYQPSEDILGLFSVKLGIPKEYFTQFDSKSSPLESKLNELKKNIIVNLQNAEQILNEIKEEYPYIYSIEQEIAFQLYYCCYHSKSGRLDGAQKMYEEGILITIKSPENLSVNIRDMYYYFYSLVYFSQEKYGETLNSLKMQLLYSNNESKPYINYNIAVTTYKIGSYRKSIKHAQLALSKHLYENRWEKVAKAYNLLGILYLEEGYYDRSIKELMKGLELSLLHGHNILICRILHNLGNSFNRYGNYMKGLMYLTKALNYKKKYDTSDILITYNSIIESLFNLSRIDFLDELFDGAKKHIKNKTQECLYETTIAKIKLASGDSISYERYMEKAVTYFHGSKQWRHLLKLSKELGDYYYQLKKYKKAADYYNIEITAMKKINEYNNYD